MKLHGAFRNVELAGDFLVGKIFQEQVEDFLLAAAEIRDGIRLEAAALGCEDGIDETGEELAGNPEASAGDQRESVDQLFTGFDVGEKTLHAEAKEREAVGIVMLFADNDEAGFRIAFENIGEERAGGRLCSVRVDDVNLGARRLEVAQIGRKRRFELFGDDFEFYFRKNTLELAQHQRVRRKDANRQFGRSAFRSHYPSA